MANEETMSNIVFIIDDAETTINDDGSITVIATLLSNDATPESLQSQTQQGKESEVSL